MTPPAHPARFPANRASRSLVSSLPSQYPGDGFAAGQERAAPPAPPPPAPPPPARAHPRQPRRALASAPLACGISIPQPCRPVVTGSAQQPGLQRLLRAGSSSAMARRIPWPHPALSSRELSQYYPQPHRAPTSPVATSSHVSPLTAPRSAASHSLPGSKIGPAGNRPTRQKRRRPCCAHPPHEPQPGRISPSRSPCGVAWGDGITCFADAAAGTPPPRPSLARVPAARAQHGWAPRAFCNCCSMVWHSPVRLKGLSKNTAPGVRDRAALRLSSV